MKRINTLSDLHWAIENNIPIYYKINTKIEEIPSYVLLNKKLIDIINDVKDGIIYRSEMY